ncbi:hypothetical protein M9H77_24054 [Catharanthus roseus]|uniref:Uncharacterized protein n=1 Tax=Catharanthus roseus TaxID=4058 RepID=A0ACC0AW13_CATRO|nr:hypothetical protein M9H77_24054 [Catharanthus roseus]
MRWDFVPCYHNWTAHDPFNRIYMAFDDLLEIIEVELIRTPIQRVVLFRCDWFDSSDRGIRIHPQYKIVELHKDWRYGGYDPFVLAYQEEQVSFIPYLGSKRMRTD